MATAVKALAAADKALVSAKTKWPKSRNSGRSFASTVAALAPTDLSNVVKLFKWCDGDDCDLIAASFKVSSVAIDEQVQVSRANAMDAWKPARITAVYPDDSINVHFIVDGSVGKGVPPSRYKRALSETIPKFCLFEFVERYYCSACQKRWCKACVDHSHFRECEHDCCIDFGDLHTNWGMCSDCDPLECSHCQDSLCAECCANCDVCHRKLCQRACSIKK